MPVHPVSWRPEMSEAFDISGFELSGPPQCSSRVTSNLGGELHLSYLTSLTCLVVLSPSAAARDTPVLSSLFSGSGHYLSESVSANRAFVCHLTYKSSLFVLPALVGSGGSDNVISSSFVTHWDLVTLPLHQPFTVRAANGSPLTVNTFVRALLRYEGVQLNLGLRVEIFFGTSLLTKTQRHY